MSHIDRSGHVWANVLSAFGNIVAQMQKGIGEIGIAQKAPSTHAKLGSWGFPNGQHLSILILHLFDRSFNFVQGFDGNAWCYVDSEVAHQLGSLQISCSQPLAS